MITSNIEAKYRSKFKEYFIDLVESNSRDGGEVCISREWDFFLNHLIEEGELPELARNWKCPQ